jgi:hypothetical protein
LRPSYNLFCHNLELYFLESLILYWHWSFLLDDHIIHKKKYFITLFVEHYLATTSSNMILPIKHFFACSTWLIVICKYIIIAEFLYYIDLFLIYQDHIMCIGLNFWSLKWHRIIVVFFNIHTLFLQSSHVPYLIKNTINDTLFDYYI